MATTPKSITADTVVIVAGQRFAPGVASDVETVRQQLVGMGFADVATAEAKLAKDADGTPTLEFIKKAGTKGLTGADLAARLRRVPPIAAAPDVREAARVVTDLLGGRLTFAEAVTDDLALDALQTLAATTSTAQGGSLCRALDALPASASRVRRAW